MKPVIRVTAGIIMKESRVLLAKRAKFSHLGGLWEFPGGKIEDSESAAVCLERELAEELIVIDKAEQQRYTFANDPKGRIAQATQRLLRALSSAQSRPTRSHRGSATRVVGVLYGWRRDGGHPPALQPSSAAGRQAPDCLDKRSRVELLG